MKNTGRGLLSHWVSWSNTVICRSGSFTDENKSLFSFDIVCFVVGLFVWFGVGVFPLVEIMSILTVRASHHFLFFNFIFISVSEPHWGRFSALVLTHLLCLKYPDWIQCSLHHLQSSLEADRHHWLAFTVLSSSGFIFRTCESCQFIPKAWKRWEEKKKPHLWKSLTSFSELI